VRTSIFEWFIAVRKVVNAKRDVVSMGKGQVSSGECGRNVLWLPERQVDKEKSKMVMDGNETDKDIKMIKEGELVF